MNRKMTVWVLKVWKYPDHVVQVIYVHTGLTKIHCFEKKQSLILVCDWTLVFVLAVIDTGDSISANCSPIMCQFFLHTHTSLSFLW